MFTIPMAPPNADRLRTDSLQELEDFVGRVDRPVTRVVHGRGPLGYDGALLVGTAGGVSWISLGAALSMRGSVPGPTLQIVVDGATRYRIGRRSVEVGAGSVALVPADVEVSLRREPGRYLNVQLPAGLVEREIVARRPGIRGASRVRLDVLPMNARRTAPLSDVLHGFVAALAGESPALAPHAGAKLAALIADAVLEAGGVASIRPLRDERARRLEEWIDAHIAEPITLGRLCSLAGVGERCLQKTFETRHGTSPMEFVMQRRLAAVRRSLVGAPAGSRVTIVALDHGITHLGRFSAHYRRVYGESPSATLRRDGAQVV